MKIVTLILMCYFHQPAAIFVQLEDGQYQIAPFAFAELSPGAQKAAREMCAAETMDDVPSGFQVWHLDKLNGHFLI